jgi:hypothetical protein
VTQAVAKRVDQNLATPGVYHSLEQLIASGLGTFMSIIFAGPEYVLSTTPTWPSATVLQSISFSYIFSFVDLKI